MIIVEYNPNLEQKLVFHTLPIAFGLYSKPKVESWSWLPKYHIGKEKTAIDNEKILLKIDKISLISRIYTLICMNPTTCNLGLFKFTNHLNWEDPVAHHTKTHVKCFIYLFFQNFFQEVTDQPSWRKKCHTTNLSFPSIGMYLSFVRFMHERKYYQICKLINARILAFYPFWEKYLA